VVEAGGGKVNADQPKGGRRENFAAEKQEQRGWKMKVGEKERRKPLAGQCGGEGNQKGGCGRGPERKDFAAEKPNKAKSG
jgi:hypothetical protein